MSLPLAEWIGDDDFVILGDTREQARLRRNLDIVAKELSGDGVCDIVAFLNSLTGTASVAGRLGRPNSVPSGLAVD